MREIKMARTVWANMELAKLSPGNDIKRIMEVLNSDDFTVQMNATVKIILILNEAFVRKEKANDPEAEKYLVTEDELFNATEDELGEALNFALETFKKDGEQTVIAEPKKSKKKATK